MKNEKGSVTLFVLIAMLFFLMYMVSLYIANSNSESSQIAETARIKEIYEEGTNNIDDVYKTLEGNSVTKVNAPKLANGMTPVKWDGANLVDTTVYDSTWYNYEDTSILGQENKSKWANARTQDNSMWVWIPRYAYKITYINPNDTSQGEIIDIVFLKDDTNRDFNGKNVTDENYIDEKGEKGAYRIPTSFKNGISNNFENGEWDSEITGFWVAKYKAGHEQEQNDEEKNVIFKENQTNINNINISDAFDLAKSLTQSGNPYGLTSNVDIHLTKNSEWNAIGYLAYSKYGKNEREANESTTKNEYGVYNLANGKWEWTAGYIETTGNYEIYGGSLKGEADKYKTKYEQTSNTNVDKPFSVRGGKTTEAEKNDIITFSYKEGEGALDIGFRVVLIIE